MARAGRERDSFDPEPAHRVQHLPTQSIELQINGAVVSPLNFDGVESNEADTVSVSRWRGVDLRDGKNELVAIVRDAKATNCSA